MHKSSYSCESAIFFNLTMDIIRYSCDFDFHFNNTEITPTVLDGGDEIILANWPNDKHLICNINNNIPVKIPSHPYVLVNRSILCDCRIEADNHHLLESIASYDKRITKLTMYFTINLAFTNYLVLCMAVLGVNLKGCPGARCHRCEYIGAPRYTMLIFGFSLLWGLARIKEDAMQLYLLGCNSFITTLYL